MGLSISDFDRVTLRQFNVMQKKHYEKEKMDSERDSYVAYIAHLNANRKKGTKYIKVWEDEKVNMTTDEYIESVDDTMELFE